MYTFGQQHGILLYNMYYFWIIWWCVLLLLTLFRFGFFFACCCLFLDEALCSSLSLCCYSFNNRLLSKMYLYISLRVLISWFLSFSERSIKILVFHFVRCCIGLLAKQCVNIPWFCQPFVFSSSGENVPKKKKNQIHTIIHIIFNWFVFIELNIGISMNANWIQRSWFCSLLKCYSNFTSICITFAFVLAYSMRNSAWCWSSFVAHLNIISAGIIEQGSMTVYFGGKATVRALDHTEVKW